MSYILCNEIFYLNIFLYNIGIIFPFFYQKFDLILLRLLSVKEKGFLMIYKRCETIFLYKDVTYNHF
ncbi:MAG: hypothetical protein DRG20_03870 [Deltaproteobacteria bacterium]|nr:MAG: hypothetical protein DRG20_03870 [Deltaproteobacteria bacterium]